MEPRVLDAEQFNEQLRADLNEKVRDRLARGEFSRSANGHAAVTVVVEFRLLVDDPEDPAAASCCGPCWQKRNGDWYCEGPAACCDNIF